MATRPTRAITDVRAAGAVVTRKDGHVLLVHRPNYDDWSFPKGKLERGEHAVTAAVREVAEETGLDIRLGPPLPTQRYRLRQERTKRVDYWMGRVIGPDAVEGYRCGNEIDEVAWVPWEQAADRLTYALDRETLTQAKPLRRRTRALVLIRHAAARSRKAWRGEDGDRPLLKSGSMTAQRLVPILAAYDVTRIASSPSIRCVETVRPYADACGFEIDQMPILSEQSLDAEALIDLIEEVLAAKEGTVLCSHRPVLPTLIDAVGGPATRLDPGEMMVIHHRKTRVVAIERHLPGVQRAYGS